MFWARMVAYVTGTVNQELLLRNEYLGAENRILRGQIKGRLLLSEGEKATLAEIAQRLGRKALEELAAVAKPDTLLAWYRKLIANKFDGSRFRQRVGRPRIDEEAERLVVQMVKGRSTVRRIDGGAGIGIARKRMLPCNRADTGCVALTGQHYLTGNGADFAMAFKLEAICGTDEGSNANDGGASCWCGFPHA
jgi:hypothetical protein